MIVIFMAGGWSTVPREAGLKVRLALVINGLILSLAQV
jgi:hypothetical protein